MKANTSQAISKKLFPTYGTTLSADQFGASHIENQTQATKLLNEAKRAGNNWDFQVKTQAAIVLAAGNTVGQKNKKGKLLPASKIVFSRTAGYDFMCRSNLQGSYLNALNNELEPFGVYISRHKGEELIVSYDFGSSRPIWISDIAQLPDDIQEALNVATEIFKSGIRKAALIDLADLYVRPLF
ncbi:hypothetical protein [Photobacterium satsumensis]|uniref:hypothetical protein n=1 Tax=Photobacterium satsumensis TaxID=2910239 RepID=UPI003D12D261